MTPVLLEIKEIITTVFKEKKAMLAPAHFEEKGFVVKTVAGKLPIDPIYLEVSKNGEEYTIIDEENEFNIPKEDAAFITEGIMVG